MFYISSAGREKAKKDLRSWRFRKFFFYFASYIVDCVLLKENTSADWNWTINLCLDMKNRFRWSEPAHNSRSMWDIGNCVRWLCNRVCKFVAQWNNLKAQDLQVDRRNWKTKKYYWQRDHTWFDQLDLTMSLPWVTTWLTFYHKTKQQRSSTTMRFHFAGRCEVKVKLLVAMASVFHNSCWTCRWHGNDAIHECPRYEDEKNISKSSHLWIHIIDFLVLTVSCDDFPFSLVKIDFSSKQNINQTRDDASVSAIFGRSL